MNLIGDYPKLVKSENEIELMKISVKISAQVLKKVLENVKIGVTCFALDKIARQEIEKKGATPSFMTVDDYKWTICTTVNQQVVHGIPNKQPPKNGDILGVDIGALYHGCHSDMAITIPIGKVSPAVEKFLEVGKKTLEKAISCAKIGNGIGRELHEEPMVPGFGKSKTGPKILRNMVLAIEVIYTQGSGEVKLEKDNWTISSVDGSLAGLFEQTVLITADGPIVLTPYL